MKKYYYYRKETNTLFVVGEAVVCDLNMLHTIVESAKEQVGKAKFATDMTALYTAQPIDAVIPAQGMTFGELLEQGLVTELENFEDIVNVEL